MKNVKKHIDLSSLDRYNGTEKIDWNKSATNKRNVKFLYNNTTGYITILSYSHKTKTCGIRYDGQYFSLPSKSILHGNLRNIVYKKDFIQANIPYTPKRDNINHVYFLYCHTNKINGKKYIGITKKSNPKYRWNNGKGYSNNEYFYRSIKKYGWDNFEHEILLRNITELEASEKEKEYIMLYNTTNRDLGYNIIVGGIDEMYGNNHPNSKEIYKYDINGNFICKYESIVDASNELKLDNSGNLNRALHSDSHYAYGYLWHNKYYTNVSKYLPSEEIIQYSLVGDFIHKYPSIKDIDTSLYSKDKIRECCKHKSKKHKGYIWLYATDKNDISFYVKELKYKKKCSPNVIQYDTNSNYIRSYLSIYEASDLTGIPSQSIYKACKHELKTSYGYIWEYDSAN